MHIRLSIPAVFITVLILIILLFSLCSKISPNVPKSSEVRYDTIPISSHISIKDRDSCIVDGKGDTVRSIEVINCNNIIVKNLVVLDTSRLGILIAVSNDVYIDSIVSNGHKYAGLYAWDVMNFTVNHSSFSENGYSGVVIECEWPYMTNRNVTVKNINAFRNPGNKGEKPHTGHGIFIEGTVNGLVDSCRAWENGYLWGDGNIGIWTAQSKYVTIQNCEAFKNISVTGIDGGGFDIDGGCSYCVIQKCYSWENYGAGYLLYEWGSDSIMTDNTLRNNVSLHDGINTNYSAFSLGGTKNVYNTFIIDNTATPRPNKPAVTYFSKGYLINLVFQGNNFGE